MVRWYAINFLSYFITTIMYLDNHDYKNHVDLIIVTKNNHDILIFNDNCPILNCFVYYYNYMYVCVCTCAFERHLEEVDKPCFN